MILFPAIDLKNGECVRLEQGDMARATVFNLDPAAQACAFEQQGFEYLHVVDLDGAFAGAPVQRALVERLVAASRMPVQVGGGIRDRAAVEAIIAAGASRVVLGTAAVRDPKLVEEVCRAHPHRIVIAVDARDGVVAVAGWVEASDITAIELGKRAAAWGAAALLYTDVARDGTGAGPNIPATAALSRDAGIEVIASGGVSSLDDLRALRDAGIPAVVVGRALYDKRFTLAEAVRVAHEARC